jgi:hypothetical protein
MSDTPVPYRQLYGPPDQLIVGALVHEGEQVTTGGFVGRIREQSFVHETSEGSSDQFYIPGNGAVEKQGLCHRTYHGAHCRLSSWSELLFPANGSGRSFEGKIWR